MSETTTVLALRDNVENALAAVRPSLQAHGGDVELVDVTDEGVVSVRLAGACHGRPGAVMTMRLGVERLLKQQVPEVTRVEAV
jgi:Fe-S cluster biogenesis protein NfuA